MLSLPIEKKIENKTRMKTSISSKAFVALPTGRRAKYSQNRGSFMRGICIQKIGAISQLKAEKIAFPPKPDIQTDRRTLAFI